jgi:hypothetical protein
MDIEAESQVRDYRVILITGRGDNPKLALRSDPAAGIGNREPDRRWTHTRRKGHDPPLC